MAKLFNAIPRHKKLCLVDTTDAQIKRETSYSQKLEELLEKEELSEKEIWELKKAVASGKIFIDLENKIRGRLKCLQIGK